MNQFKLRYAPHFGMFKHSAGEDLVDQLRFAAEQGFTAWEDNGMPNRDIEIQEKVAEAMVELDMLMGVFVATGSFKEATMASDDQDIRDRVLEDIRNAVDIAKRVNAKWCTVVPGLFDMKLAWDYQTANVIELLKRASEICEPSGLVMVLEPLNRLINHPGVFL
ncbi:MAG: TIM barrel protein, partial [Planctomycetota bacterium]|nr:TIM barrel protein [Planctomycetota bacterium]